MASTKGELSTPVARAKSATGSAVTAEPVAAAAATASAAPVAKPSRPIPNRWFLRWRMLPSRRHRPNRPKPSALRPRECKANRRALRFRARRFRPATSRRRIPPRCSRQCAAPASPCAKTAESADPNQPRPPPQSLRRPLPQTGGCSQAAPAKPALPPDPASEAALVEFIDRQILPYLRARRGERFRLARPRFSDDTFRFVKLRVTETYRSRVEEIQGWCDERRMLDLQTRLHHWLHAWLFIHVPFSFLLLMLTIWHAWVTLFYY